ncbi:PTS sugar transporter subunit IIA [Microvirga guangxiensis]|uniref:PTS system, nitrogen regulatory IIA component n=1 Tax=Microvirga guangxiensis TaxID=549386 RepID=A0A1G5H1U1_9HYPH|nr:PTS sugar transporter subunit IIA [Microvirga guangxiensis]SCY57825.1 PTS system, nitrogen regulatory IIA component [Microvirga guangxiensis]
MVTMASTMMTTLISPARVVSRLHARDVQQIIGELVRLASTEVSLDCDAVCRAVLERGDASTFGFGRGIAIPHAATRGIDQPIGAFARLKPAQDFGAADDIPADLVFLLLSPDGDDPTHLRALACVARRLRDREVAARLRSAKDAEAIHVVLTSDAWREPDDEPEPGHSATRLVNDLTNGAMCTSLGALC